MKRITSSLLALLLALSMLIGMVPAAYAAPADTIESINSTETVDSTETEDVSDESEDVAAYAAEGGEETVTSIDLDTFLKWLKTSGYTVNGASYPANENAVVNGKLVVKWSPKDGCFDQGRTHECTVGNVVATGNTPKRLNSDLLQFQLLEGQSDPVTVKNVKFVYVPATVTVCENSDWKGTFTADEKTPDAQLYFMTTGDVTFENCDFEKTVLTTFNTTGKTTVTNCSFKDVYNSYAIKDIRGANITVENTTITNCGGGIMISQPAKTTAVNSVTLTSNVFTNVDNDTEWSTKPNTRGIIQIQENGVYTNAELTVTNNTATSCGPVLRQRNNSAIAKVEEIKESLTEQFKSDLYTENSTAKPSEPTGVATSEQLIAAIAAANDGDTITLGEGEFTTHGNTSPNKSLTFVGSGAGTIWTIGDLNKHTKGEANGDYSFDGCNTITFKSMKLRSDSDDYRGFIRVTNTVVEDCVLDGKTAYWGYTTASFKDCTFNAPTSDYAIWDYSSPSMTFDNCTFNGDGKAVNVYVEQPSSTERKIEIKNCKANFTKDNKSLLNIKNSNQAWDVALSGTNTVTVNGDAVADRLYQVELPTISEKTGETVKVQEEQTDGTYQTVFETTVKSDAAAKIGEKEYESLEAALKDVTLETPLTWVSDTAWPAATPVYYNGTFYATIGELLYDAQQKKGVITPEANVETAVIYCRPGATIATRSNGDHPSYVTSTTIYGNGAKLAGSTEWDVENYYTLTKDITINLYNLNGGASVWGTRKSDYTVTVNMVNCEDAHEVLFNYGSGNGKVIVTVKSSTFLKSGGAAHGWPVSINCLGSLTVERCTFDGVITGVVVNVKQPAGDSNRTMTVSVKNSTFNNVTGQDGNKGALRVTGQQECDIDLTIADVAFTGSHAEPEDITIGNVKSAENLGKVSYEISGTTASMKVHKTGETEAPKEEIKASETYTGNNIGKSSGDGSEANPYTLEDLRAMTRAEYIAAQERLGGTMYVKVGTYAYEKDGVLGNGTAKNSDKDATKLNYYGAPGAKDGQYSDAAVGKNIVFVGGKITSNVTGYKSIDDIGTSLLLAVPAYTNVTFEGTTFKNVMSFNYQLYTSPWSQLGELKFDGCTFNGIIVGAIAAQTLTFNKCTFANYTNTVSANSSNPTWIRPAYGNWSKGDNEGQGGDFKSLTTINFTGNTVTSTRPVKFERIAQWEMPTTVTVTGNSFDIRDTGEKKNVGLYFGANAKFKLIADKNTKSDSTAALYTAVYSAPNGKNYAGLPAGSTVKDSTDKDAVLEDAYEWKSTKKLTLKTTKEVAEVNGVKFATLAEAITAAENGKTITLLDDLTETDAADAAIVYNLTGKTLDLNGKTYTHNNFAHVFEGTGGTIKNGKMVCVNGSYALFIGGDEVETTNFTVDGVELTGGINIYNATGVVLKNLTVNGTNYYAVWLDEGAAATIESGTYNAGDVAAFNAAKGSALAITGGTVNTNGKPLMGESGGTLSVSGGTFDTETVKGYCAAGFVPVKKDGVYSVEEDKVAQIGDKTYPSLAAAIAAAKDGDTVTLLKSCNGNGIKIETENFAAKGLTVDFGGNTYSVGGVLVGSAGTGTNAFQLLEGGKVTFQNGTIAGVTEGTKPAEDTPNWHGAPALVIQNYCDLTLKSMTITGGDETVYTMSNNHGNIVIEDTTITAGKAKGYGSGPFAFDVCGYSSYNGVSVTVRGKSIINGDIEVSRSNANDVKLTLESGTINGELKIDESIQPGDATTITKSDVVTLDAPSGYKWVDSTLTKITYVAEVNDKTYDSLQAAITAAADKDTVTLLADTKEDVTINKNITLDLNGFTLTNEGAKHTITVNEGVSLTIEDSVGTGTVDNVTHGRGALVNNGTVILSGGTFERSAEKGTFEPYGNGGNSWYTIANYGTMTINNGTTVKNAGGYSSNIRNGGQDSIANLTINGGTFDGGVNTVKNDANGVLEIKGGELKNTAQYVIMNWNQATISGGTFETAETAGAVLFSSAYGDGSALCGELTITGGTFKAAGNELIDDAYDANNHGTVKISGGSFNRAVDPKHCDTGFIPKDNGDGTYGVKEGTYVAAIGEKKYATLKEAVDAAKNGETVTLLADVDLDAQIATGKAITINGQGKYTIKATKKLVGTSNKAGMFYRTTSAQGTLTFLNVTLDGNGVSKIFLNEGGAGETVFDGVTSINGGGISYGSGIHISGGGSHATIKNSTLTGSKGTTELSEANYFAANDLWVGGNVYVTVENSTIGYVFVNSAPSATATNNVVHGQLTITGANTRITYLSGEEEAADKLDKFGNNGSLVKIDSGNVETIFDKGSYEISGGTFKTEVKPEWCADGYVPVDNGDGTYTVDEISTEASYIDADGKLQLGLLKDLLYLSGSKGKKLTIYKDIEIDYVVLLNDRELNLNGHTLTVNDTFVAVTGSVKDTEDGKGLIKIDAKNLHLAPNNGNVGQIPIFDSAKGGYRLFNFTMTGRTIGKGNGVEVDLRPEFTNPEAYELMKAGSTNNITFTVTISWMSENGPASQEFIFVQRLVDNVADKNGNGFFFIILNGLDSDMVGSIKDIKAQGSIKSGTGASVNSVYYDIPQN